MTLKNSALDPPTILIRCDASHRMGFGHVVRCLALADELHESYGCSVSFAMREDNNGFKTVRKKGYSVITPINTEAFDYKTWIESAIHDTGAKALILDIRDDLPSEVLKALKSKQSILLATIDDSSNRRLDVDLAFYPPVPQLKHLDWRGFEGKLFSGWKWVILRKEFYKRNKSIIIQKSIPRILVTMGGSDPLGMTLKAIRALDMLEENFDTVVVTGAGFLHRQELNKLLSKVRRHFVVKENVTDMAELMTGSDLAIASFGTTSYELAACGVPTIYLCLTEDHAQSAAAFVQEGMAVCLGLYDAVPDTVMTATVGRLLKNTMCRLQMGQSAQQHMDGQGAIQVAQKIISHI